MNVRTVDSWESNPGTRRDRRSNVRRRVTAEATAGFGRGHATSPYQLIAGFYTDAGDG